MLLSGTNCIGCLSCVQYCPNQAINIGSITKHRNLRQSAARLCIAKSRYNDNSL